MGIKIKKMKNEKPKHIVFLCYTLSIQVDKRTKVDLDIFKPKKSCIYPLTLNSVLINYEVKHEEKWYWVSNM
jgi:hypothetical protein